MKQLSRIKRISAVVGSMIVAGLASNVFAAGLSCSTDATRILLDGTTYVGTVDTTGPIINYYRFYPVVGRSFMAVAHTTNAYSPPAKAIDLALFEDGTCSSSQTGVRDLSAHLPIANGADPQQVSAKGFIATSATESIRVTGGSTPTDYYLRVMETTLYASWFYIGGDYNSWITLQNTSGGPINYQVTVRDQAGAALALPPAPLAINATALINIRDYAGSIPGGAIMGSVQVAHDGPLGAIRGNLANLTHTGMGLTMDFFTRAIP